MKPGRKLPSVRSLATQLSHNPNTHPAGPTELKRRAISTPWPERGALSAARRTPTPPRRASLTGDLRKLMGELRYLGVTAEEAMTLIKEVYEQ